MRPTAPGRNFRPNLLCIAPPYGWRVPAGAAYLLGYLKAKGIDDFDVVDLRVGAPLDYSPTYKKVGAFGESFVMDIPDLPLALFLIEAFRAGRALTPERTELFDRYCIERGMSPQFVHAHLRALDRYYAVVFEQLPRIDFIGFSTWTENYLSTLMAAAHLKRRRNPPVIVAGGPQVTASHASAALGLRSGLFDLVVSGEGEETLYDVYTSWRDNGVLPLETPGTVTLDAATGALRRTERRLGRLDLIPAPSYSEIAIQAYQPDDDCRALPLHFSRGCTDKCSFCSEWVFWKVFRPDTAEHTVDIMKQMQARYDANYIQFYDSLMNGHPKRLVAFAEQLLADGVKIGWTGSMRAQMDAETARLIARAGCAHVFVGIESFSDETLELMNKRRTEADNVRSVTAFLEAGIDVTAGFIPGFPGDTRHGFLHSVAVLRELQERFPGRLDLHEEPFTVSVNSPIHTNPEKLGLRPHRWAEEYLDIAPRYRDVTDAILCTVDGAEQGLERIGRATIVGAVKTDALVRGFFDSAPDEELPVQTFGFDYVQGGWSVARKKTAAGHRYCLLVDDDEMQSLIALQHQCYPVDEANDPRIAGALEAIEKLHVVPPSRTAPRIIRTMYERDGADRCTYAVAPFVVARTMGWRYDDDLLVWDSVNERWSQREAEEAKVMSMLYAEPRTLAQLWDSGAFTDRAWLRDAVHDLKEDGIVVVCDFGEMWDGLQLSRAG